MTPTQPGQPVPPSAPTTPSAVANGVYQSPKTLLGELCTAVDRAVIGAISGPVATGLVGISSVTDTKALWAILAGAGTGFLVSLGNSLRSLAGQ